MVKDEDGENRRRSVTVEEKGKKEIMHRINDIKDGVKSAIKEIKVYSESKKKEI